jgi:hypothetical protein
MTENLWIRVAQLTLMSGFPAPSGGAPPIEPTVVQKKPEGTPRCSRNDSKSDEQSDELWMIVHCGVIRHYDKRDKPWNHHGQSKWKSKAS